MNEFERLLADLEAVQEMHKAMPPSMDDEDEDEDEDAYGKGKKDPADKQVAAAAKEEEDDGDGYGDEMMGKSMTVYDSEGLPVNAVDGTALIKSLLVRLESAEDKMKGTGEMMKALSQTVQLVSQQADLIKSLQDRVNGLSGEGRGRKSAVVFPMQKQGSSEQMAKSMGDQQKGGVSAPEFMAKALAAQAQGLITGLEVSRAESHLNHGLQVPADIVNRVAQAK